MKKYELILMDLDDTITDDMESRRGAYEVVCEKLGSIYNDHSFKSFVKSDNEFWRKYEGGEIKLPEWVKTFEDKVKWLRPQRFINHFKGIDFEKATELNKIYCKNLANEIVLIKEADTFIKYATEKYKLVIASNGPIVAAEEKLKKVNMLQYFSYIIVAEDIGDSKPNKEFFYKLMQRINYYNTDKMVIIGDSLYSDVAGGNTIGCDVFWFNHRNNKKPKDTNITYEFKEYKELIKYL